MKKLLFLLLLIPMLARAQFPTPTGLTQFGSSQFFYKISGGDTTVYAKSSNGLWFPMGRASDLVFSTNFQGLGTLASSLDLANSVRISGTMTADQGFLTGDITNTAHQGYFTKSLVGSNGVTGAFSVSSKLGGGASINSITGSGAVHVISLPNLANPYFSPDSGAHNYPLLAVANFVGLTYDTTTYTLTATGSGGAFLPLSFTGDNTVSLNGHEFDISDTNLTYSLSNSSFLQRMLTSSSSTEIIQGPATLNMNAVDQITGDNAAIEVDQGPVAAFISTQLATSGFEKKLLLSAVSGNGIPVTDQIDNIGLNGAVVFPKVYGTQYAQYSKVDSIATAKADSVVAGGGFGTGTVTSFSKTDGFGIVSSVANPTTTPNHTVRVDSTLVGSKSWAFAAFNTKAQDASTYVPLTRTITINGTAFNLSADRSWTVGSTVTPVSGETPTGLMNGSNVRFTSAHTPIAGSLSIVYNGLILQPTVDYTFSGTTATLVLTGHLSGAPVSTDYLLFNYQY